MSAMTGHPGVGAVHDALLTGSAWACWAAAAALAVPQVRAKVQDLAATLDRADPRLTGRAAFAAGAAAAGWTMAVKTTQYLAFQLTIDSSIIANTAANVLAGNGLACTVDGTPSVLAIHFAFFAPLFLAPVLLVWASALPLVLLQAAALGSLGPAAFLLGRRAAGSATAGFALMLVAYAHPSFHQLATANLENAVFQPPLFLWGAVLWAGGRRVWGAALWALALTTRENFPVTLASLGVLHALTAEKPARRRLLEGAAIVGGAACLWYAVIRVIAAHADTASAAGYWGHYAHFGADRGEILRTVFLRPDRLLAHVLRPSHLAPFLSLAAGAALLPFAYLPALVFLACTAAHHLLESSYHFNLQYSSYTFGPLLLASALGLGRLWKHPRLAGAGAALLVPVLAAAGWDLRGASRVLNPDFSAHLVAAAPRLLAQVPSGASAWAEQFSGTWLAARPQLKLLDHAVLRARFDELLFRPEYVLVDKGFLLFLPLRDRVRVVGFLARAGYLKVDESGPLILLKDPQAPRGGKSPELVLAEEPGDAERVTPYLAALLDSDAARARLAAYPPDLRYEPAVPELESALALTLLERGLGGLAHRHAQRAAARFPNSVTTRTVWGEVLLRTGHAEEAALEFRAALALDVRFAPAAKRLAFLLLSRGAAPEALAVTEKALAGHPADADLHNNRGAALRVLGRTADARAAFSEAVRLAPGHALARRNLERLAPSAPARG